MATEGREIEVKLRIADINKLRAQLRSLGAKPAPRVFERNVLYDTPGSELRETGRLLRIRVETPASSGRLSTRAVKIRPSTRGHAHPRGILTYKAPLSPGIEESLSSRYKQKKEIEIEFHPAENLEIILTAIGLRPGFQYEKFRTKYHLRRFPDLHLDLDETPLGVYLEIEGSPTAIDRAAFLLGFPPEDYITASYWDLHVADARGRSVTPGDLLFENRKK